MGPSVVTVVLMLRKMILDRVFLSSWQLMTEVYLCVKGMYMLSMSLLADCFEFWCCLYFGVPYDVLTRVPREMRNAPLAIPLPEIHYITFKAGVTGSAKRANMNWTQARCKRKLLMLHPRILVVGVLVDREASTCLCGRWWPRAARRTSSCRTWCTSRADRALSALARLRAAAGSPRLWTSSESCSWCAPRCKSAMQQDALRLPLVGCFTKNEAKPPPKNTGAPPARSCVVQVVRFELAS